jgi:hypothetical protein
LLQINVRTEDDEEEDEEDAGQIIINELKI